MFQPLIRLRTALRSHSQVRTSSAFTVLCLATSPSLTLPSEVGVGASASLSRRQVPFLFYLVFRFSRPSDGISQRNHTREEQGSICWTRNGASRANQTYCQKHLRAARKAPLRTGAAGARARSGPGRPPARPARASREASAGASQPRSKREALSMAIEGL
jgi:hypothetical protein